MTMLADGAVFVFIKYLQILLWIFLPAMAIAMVITTIAHYKRKSRNKNEGKPGIDLPQPSVVGFIAGSNKANNLQHQLSFSNAKCIALKKDFETLEEKYSVLLENVNKISETSKQDPMDNIKPELGEIPQEQIDSIKEQHENETRDLAMQVEKLNAKLKSMEVDNTALKEQLSIYANDNKETAAIFQKWEDEKNELKNQITEQEYLKDVLEAKKLQIDFLRQQLDQRIRNHHLVEHQFRELGVKFTEVNQTMEGMEESAFQMKAVIGNKNAEIMSLQEVIVAKTDHANQLEKNIMELEEKSKLDDATIEEKQNLIINLTRELENINERRKHLEEKIAKNQQLFRGFHRKLADLLENDADVGEKDEIQEPPVISMKPVYQKAKDDTQLNGSIRNAIMIE